MVLTAHLVQHNAQDIRPGMLQLLLHIARQVNLHLAAANNHHHAVNHSTQNQCIRNRQHRRQVNQHIIINLSGLLQQLPHALAAQQLARVRRNHAACQRIQVIHLRSLHCSAQRCVHADAAGKPQLIGKAKILVHSRVTHIAIHNQHALACLRQHHRQIGNSHALALVRRAAGNSQRLQLLTGLRKLDAGADNTVCLRRRVLQIIMSNQV